MSTFEATRPTVGAQALGIARAAYEYALDYAKERKAFGKPIIMNQAIAFKLANMITEIDAARLLIWRAAWLARNGGYVNAEGSMSKYKASEVAVLGDRGGDPDPRRLRLHPGVPRRALAPRRQDPHDLRGHERDPAAGDRPGDHPACASSSKPARGADRVRFLAAHGSGVVSDRLGRVFHLGHRFGPPSDQIGDEGRAPIAR